MQIDFQHLKEFDVPVPRYTSYPTALSLTECKAQEVVEFENVRRPDGPVSLYFHLPFCQSLCWYCACTKIITNDRSKSRVYLERVRKELQLKKAWFEGRKMTQLHLGGGTPTFMTTDELAELLQMTREVIEWAEDAEIGIEIDPRTLDEGDAFKLAEAGFNRASLGVQDHDPKVQRAIHRIQPLEQTRAAVESLRAAGFGSINMDLIYGLPVQTLESFNQTIEDVIALRPDRLAIYSYAHVPWAAPAQKILETRYGLPSADEKIQLFLLAAQKLDDAGYVHIGMDHFALPEDSLSKALHDQTLRRNFQGYSTQAGVEIHGFGMSSISQTDRQYFQNAKELEDWEAAIDFDALPVIKRVVLSEEDALRRDIIMAIMCSAKLDLDALSGAYGWSADDFQDEWSQLRVMQDKGLVELEGSTLQVTPVGRFFVRNIAAIFDTYRAAQKGFSKAI